MIALVSGTLVRRELDRVEILTAGGVGYECLIPLSVFESLPQEGATITLHTHLAVREDAWHLYGFSDRYDRAVFQRLLVAKGVGPALALGILSSLTPERVVRALREKDITTLMRVPRVGRKKAEQIILDGHRGRSTRCRRQRRQPGRRRRHSRAHCTRLQPARS